MAVRNGSTALAHPTARRLQDPAHGGRRLPAEDAYCLVVAQPPEEQQLLQLHPLPLQPQHLRAPLR